MSARANRRAFAFGSFARKGLIGERAGGAAGIPGDVGRSPAGGAGRIGGGAVGRGTAGDAATGFGRA